MSESFGAVSPTARHAERGAARLKLIITIAVVAALAYMAIQYVPVAYQASSYKSEMQASLDTAVAMGHSGEWIVSQLRAKAGENGVPANAEITPAVRDGRMEVTVKFTRPINLLPGFTYNYNFDYTAKSNQFLSK